MSEFSSLFQNIVVRGSPLQEIETGGHIAWSRSKGSQTVVVPAKGNMSWYMLALSLIPPLHLIIVWLRDKVLLCSPGTYLRQASNSQRCACLCPLVQCIFWDRVSRWTRAHPLGRLVGYQVLPVSAQLWLGLQKCVATPSFSVGAGDPNSGLHAVFRWQALYQLSHLTNPPPPSSPPPLLPSSLPHCFRDRVSAQADSNILCSQDELESVNLPAFTLHMLGLQTCCQV